MKIEILEPFGYCAGVERAMKMTLEVKKVHQDQEVVVLGMLVHNADALNELSKAGVTTIFDENKSLVKLIDRVDNNAIVILTAHGHSLSVEEELNRRNIEFIDATCPFVTLTENVIKKAVSENRDVLYLGKKNHPEANAALSISNKVHLIEPKNVHLDEKYTNPLVISQTTFSESEIAQTISFIKDALKEVSVSESICQASTLRQNALKNLSKDVELIYVVGGKNSNNTKTLFEIASSTHPKAKVLMIENANDINKKDLLGLNYVAISSGASTPREITLAVENKIKSLLN
ncbi:MAG: 4-hydroxy-3-methylbut-2-enyl diphosphate reductase [Bacilli bacterium]|nr:4-hydroxy-3-methylbut-2-enyl diphosphate reductase [Bacilli bacterium]